jgi:acyl-CoA thioesterase-1
MFKWMIPSLLLWFGSAAAGDPAILVLGDSISAAYGLPSIDRGWVAMLQQRLHGRGVRVVNASIPGDTTAGGLQRVGELLSRDRPVVVLVELGANDGLRGLPLTELKANLNGIVSSVQASKAHVVLLGMRLPPNYGKRYADAFANAYKEMAAERKLAYVPFLLDGVGGQSGMMQMDGLHPNESAQSVILENVWRVLEPLLHQP